jgi:hypothetical protein
VDVLPFTKSHATIVERWGIKDVCTHNTRIHKKDKKIEVERKEIYFVFQCHVWDDLD